MTHDPALQALLNTVEAAGFLRLAPTTLRTWRSRGFGPKYVQFGGGSRRSVRYRIRDLEDFICAETASGSKHCN